MSERRPARWARAWGIAALLLADAPRAFATSRCPPGTESRPIPGFLLLGAGVVLAIAVPWHGLPTGRRQSRAGRLVWAALDVVAGLVCLAIGAIGFFYFAVGCFTR